MKFHLQTLRINIMGQSKKDNKEIGIRLLKIQETGFSIDVPLLQNIDPKEDLSKNIIIEMGLSLPKESKENTFELKTKVQYYYTHEQNQENKNIKSIKKKALELETSNLFELDGLEKHLTFNDDSINDNSGVIPIMLRISVGALRGILITKTAGTCLSNFPLPIMDIDDDIDSFNKESVEKEKKGNKKK